jgi:hypothetical protein
MADEDMMLLLVGMLLSGHDEILDEHRKGNNARVTDLITSAFQVAQRVVEHRDSLVDNGEDES